MCFWLRKKQPDDPICDWLVANKRQIRDGTAEYMGAPIDESTEFYQFEYAFSFFIGTLNVTTPYDLPTPSNNYLNFAAWKYTLISLLFGWWSIPWGPVFTVKALAVSMNGGRKRTAASLIQLAEWGWDSPDAASTNEHRKDLLEISAAAAQEIRSRMEKGGYSADLAVRITPTEWADTEIEIAFDYPVSDGRDWVDESQGLLVLVDKNHEEQLSGTRIEFCEGQFTATQVSSAKHD